jgi:hypothetical protein
MTSLSLGVKSPAPRRLRIARKGDPWPAKRTGRPHSQSCVRPQHSTAIPRPPRPAIRLPSTPPPSPPRIAGSGNAGLSEKTSSPSRGQIRGSRADRPAATRSPVPNYHHATASRRKPRRPETAAGTSRRSPERSTAPASAQSSSGPPRSRRRDRRRFRSSDMHGLSPSARFKRSPAAPTSHQFQAPVPGTWNFPTWNFRKKAAALL